MISFYQAPTSTNQSKSAHAVAQNLHDINTTSLVFNNCQHSLHDHSTPHKDIQRVGVSDRWEQEGVSARYRAKKARVIGKEFNARAIYTAHERGSGPGPGDSPVHLQLRPARFPQGQAAPHHARRLPTQPRDDNEMRLMDLKADMGLQAYTEIKI